MDTKSLGVQNGNSNNNETIAFNELPASFKIIALLAYSKVPLSLNWILNYLSISNDQNVEKLLEVLNNYHLKKIDFEDAIDMIVDGGIEKGNDELLRNFMMIGVEFDSEFIDMYYINSDKSRAQLLEMVNVDLDTLEDIMISSAMSKPVDYSKLAAASKS